MVRQEGPGEDLDPGGVQLPGEPAEEVLPVLVITEEDLPVQPSRHHMVEDPSWIEARGVGHNEREDTIK